MSNDDTEKFLREEARRLVTDLFRDPTLAVEYRDVMIASCEDSSLDDIVTRWMGDAGYSTRQDLLQEAFAEAPRTNLAAWDGAYLLRVGGSALLLLEIDRRGVTLERRRLADATFADGALQFSTSESSPWAGELRFSRIAPKDGTPIAAGGVFQKRCTGKVWKKEDAKPAEDNAAGATMRLELAAGPQQSSRNAAMLASVAGVSAQTSTREFLDAWKGDYKVTLIGATTNPTTGLPETVAGPDYGVGGDDDQHAVLTFVEPAQLDLTSKTVQPQKDHLVYTSGKRTFELRFATFTEGVLSFSGKIYAEGSTPPTQANASGVAGVPLPASPEWSSSVITATALSALSLAVTVGAIVAGFATVYWGDKRVVRRELKKAQGDGDQQKVEALQQEEDQLIIDLNAKAIHNGQGVELFSPDRNQQKKAALSISESLGDHAKSFDEIGLSAKRDFERLSGEVQKSSELIETQKSKILALEALSELQSEAYKDALRKLEELRKENDELRKGADERRLDFEEATEKSSGIKEDQAHLLEFRKLPVPV